MIRSRFSYGVFHAPGPFAAKPSQNFANIARQYRISGRGAAMAATAPPGRSAVQRKKFLFSTREIVDAGVPSMTYLSRVKDVRATPSGTVLRVVPHTGRLSTAVHPDRPHPDWEQRLIGATPIMVGIYCSHTSCCSPKSAARHSTRSVGRSNHLLILPSIRRIPWNLP